MTFGNKLRKYDFLFPVSLTALTYGEYSVYEGSKIGVENKKKPYGNSNWNSSTISIPFLFSIAFILYFQE